VKSGRIDNYLTYGASAGGTVDNNIEFNRLNSKSGYEQTILSQKFDFMIDISGHDDYILKKGLEGYVPRKPLVSPWDQSYRNAKLDMYSDIIKRKNIKGILTNASSFTPYRPFEIVSIEQVRNELAKYQKSSLLDERAKRIFADAKIDSLLGTRVNMNIKPFIRNNEKISIFTTSIIQDVIRLYDKPLRSKLADQLGWPEIDLNFITTQIYTDKFITLDGLKISYKDIHDKYILTENNLISIIVANEALKAINEYYGTTFPYINTRDYLKSPNQYINICRRWSYSL
jgi:hypothetical protein